MQFSDTGLRIIKETLGPKTHNLSPWSLIPKPACPDLRVCYFGKKEVLCQTSSPNIWMYRENPCSTQELLVLVLIILFRFLCVHMLKLKYVLFYNVVSCD